MPVCFFFLSRFLAAFFLHQQSKPDQRERAESARSLVMKLRLEKKKERESYINQMVSLISFSVKA